MAASHLKYNVSQSLSTQLAGEQFMIAQNPFDQFRQECLKVLSEAIKKAMPEIKGPEISLKKTPNIDFGQLATSLCFE